MSDMRVVRATVRQYLIWNLGRHIRLLSTQKSSRWVSLALGGIGDFQHVKLLPGLEVIRVSTLPVLVALDAGLLIAEVKHN